MSDRQLVYAGGLVPPRKASGPSAIPRHGLDSLKKARYGPFDPLFVGALASAYAACGQVREGLRSIERLVIAIADW